MPEASEGETCDVVCEERLKLPEELLPGVEGREDVGELIADGGYHDCEELSWGRAWACWSCDPLKNFRGRTEDKSLRIETGYHFESSSLAEKSITEQRFTLCVITNQISKQSMMWNEAPKSREWTYFNPREAMLNFAAFSLSSHPISSNIEDQKQLHKIRASIHSLSEHNSHQ